MIKTVLRLVGVLGLMGLMGLMGLGVPVWAQETVNLRPAFEDGQRARYSFWSDRLTNAKVQAGSQVQTQSRRFAMEGEVTWQVASVKPDGSARCTMVYDWIQATSTGPDGTQQVNDSRRGSGPTPPLHAFLKAIVGKPLTVEISAEGKAANLKGHQAIRAAMETPELAPEPEELLATVKSLAILDQAPGQARPGTSWKVDFELPHEAGRMAYATRYTLEGVSEIEGVPVATVKTRDRLTLKAQIPPTPPGVTATVQLRSSEAEGTVMFDLDRRETAGRHEYERTVIESRISAQGRTVVQETEEIRQSQLLRVEEDQRDPGPR